MAATVRTVVTAGQKGHAHGGVAFAFTMRVKGVRQGARTQKHAGGGEGEGGACCLSPVAR